MTINLVTQEVRLEHIGRVACRRRGGSQRIRAGGGARINVWPHKPRVV